MDNITAKLRAHPSVLEVRWQIYANLEKWDGALDIASAIVKMVPAWPSGWIYWASSMIELDPRGIRDTERGGSPLSGDEITLYLNFVANLRPGGLNIMA